MNEDHYSFAWLQMSTKDMTQSSLSLTEEDVNFPHARMYAINPSKKCEMIVEEAAAMADNSHMKLLVIVNNENNYDLQDLFQRKWTTPVIVVTASTGKNLKKHTCRKGMEERVLELVQHIQDEHDFPVLEPRSGGMYFG